MRTENSFTTSASPPSPIPTGKGTRSAANEIFSAFLEKSVHIPDLSLPNRHSPAKTPPSALPEIQYRSVVSKDNESIDRLLKSAKDIGVFRITDHGISDQELQSLIEEAESVFENTGETNAEFRRNDGYRRNGKTRWTSERQSVGTNRFRSFRKKMKNVAIKLEEISEELVRVILPDAGKQFLEKIENTCTIKIFKFDRENSTLAKQPKNNIVTLNLPLNQCQLVSQSMRAPITFNLNPGTVIVTIGQQLEEWSRGEFKSVTGEISLDENFNESGSCFSIEFNYSPSISCRANNNTISLRHQFLIAIILVLLYKVFVFLFY